MDLFVLHTNVCQNFNWLGLFSGTVLLSQICSLNYSGPSPLVTAVCALRLQSAYRTEHQQGEGNIYQIGRATERSKATIRIQLNPRGAGGKENGERQRSQLLRRKGSKELFHSGRGLNVKNLVRYPFFIVHFERWSKSGHWQTNTVAIVLPCQGSALKHEGINIRELDPSHERWTRCSASKLYE